MLKFKRKMISTACVIGSALMLVGCGENLNDRPYVMTCSIEDVPYSAVEEARLDDSTFDRFAGGLNLPSNEEITRRGGREELYFRRSHLTVTEGFLEHSPVISAPMIDRRGGVQRIEQTGWYEVQEHPREGGGRTTETPMGWVDVQHFTMDASGELTPVDFQLISLWMSETRKADIAAQLPADALYVVYKKTIRDIDHPLVDSNKRITGFWALPLDDRYRWAPEDWEVAQNDPRGFSRYAFWVGNTRGGIGPGAYPHGDDWRAERSRAFLPVPAKHARFTNLTADCFAGTHAHFRQYAAIHRQHGARNLLTLRSPIHGGFVGLEESDLAHLPRDPSKWDLQPFNVDHLDTSVSALDGTRYIVEMQ